MEDEGRENVKTGGREMKTAIERDAIENQEFPMLMTDKEMGVRVILCTGIKGNVLVGVMLHDGSNEHLPGYWSDLFSARYWEPFHGTLTITS